MVVLEKTLESPLDNKIKPVNLKGNQSWIFIGRTDAEAEAPILWLPLWEELTHLKRPWCWKRLKAGEGDNRGWKGWMASLIECTWVWACSRSWQWTGKLGILQSMGSLRIRHDWVWVTELTDWLTDRYERYLETVLVLRRWDLCFLETQNGSEMTCVMLIFLNKSLFLKIH